MKNLFIWILVLTIIGIVISVVLFPSKKDIALINLKAAKYPQAEAYYKEQYDKGVKTPEVIIGLSKLNQMQGKLDISIMLIKDYLKQHPDDPSALRLLADLYRENQQDKEYFNILRQLTDVKKKANKNDLEELVEWYLNHNSPPELFAALKKLVATGKVDESYYIELASLYAQEKQYEEAHSLLKERRMLYPDKVIIGDILFEVWVDSQISKTSEEKKKFEDEAVTLVANFLLKMHNSVIDNYALSTFRYRFPELMPALLEKLAPLIKNTPSLETMILELDMDIPSRRERALEQIDTILKDPHAPQEIQNLAFGYYLEQEDNDRLLELIHKISVQNIQEKSVIDFILVAIKNKDVPLARKIKDAVGEKYFKKYPVAAASLDVALQVNGARERLDALINGKSLSYTERYLLFNVSAAANYEKEVLQIGAGLFPYIGMEEFELVDMGVAYIQVKKPGVFYQLISDAIPSIGKKKASPVLALLDISLKHPRKVAEWLYNDESVTDNTYSALFIAAQEKKEYPLALYIAKRRLNAFPSSNAKADYYLALVQVGKLEEGISSLQKIYEENKKSSRIERSYFNALIHGVKNDPRYKNNLAAFMQEKEVQPNVSNKWLKELAYVYLEDLHDVDKAKQLFLKLSEKSGAKSSEVETLVYLWGPNPEHERVEWLEQRAEESKPGELHAWLEDLNYVQSYGSVVSIFERRAYSESLSVKAYLAYMYALANMDEKQRLKQVIACVLPFFKTRKDLEELSAMAEEALYYEGKRNIWAILSYMYPEDAIVWQNLGKAAFDQHDYTAAASALQQLFSFYSSDIFWYDGQEWCLIEDAQDLFSSSLATDKKLYESLYEYGEILRKRRCYQKAETFYLLSIRQIDEARDQTVDMIKLKALMIYEMNKSNHIFSRNNRVLSLMEQAYERSSHDPDVTADYANIMMDMGYLRRTGALLENRFDQ